MQPQNLFSLLQPSVIHPDVNAGASSHAAATLSLGQSVAPFTSVTLWPWQKVPTEVQGGGDEGAACSAGTFKALWGKKKGEIRETRGLPLQPRTTVSVSACTQKHSQKYT